jgi:hypothetical protein
MLYQTTPNEDQASDSTGRIASVNIVTRDRVPLVLECLKSYVANANRAGRTSTYAVFDDSKTDDLRRPLTDLTRTEGIQADYAGLHEKQTYLERLVDKGFPRRVVEFALFGLPGFDTYGANRNAFLLHTVGELAFSSDDDVRCRVSRSPWFEEGIALGTQTMIEQMWTYPSRHAALADSPEEARDILDLHERWLGQPITDIPLKGGEHARVAVTINGLLGTGGGNDFAYRILAHRLASNRPSHERQELDAFIDATEVLRVSARTTLVRIYHMMTTFFGIDNRSLTPPFFPNFRNEDKLFAYMLAACSRDVVTAFLPYALLHTPAIAPRPQAGRHVSAAAYIGPINIIQHELEADWDFDRPANHTLRLMGARLRDLSKRPASEIRASVKAIKRKFIAAQIQYLRDLIATAASDIPASWQMRLHQLLADHIDADAKVDDAIFLWQSSVGPSQYDLPLDMIGRFGELLTHWEDLVYEARSLKQQGISMAVRL